MSSKNLVQREALLRALDAAQLPVDNLPRLLLAELGEEPRWLESFFAGEGELGAFEYLLLSAATGITVPVLTGTVSPKASAGIALRAGSLGELSMLPPEVQRRGVDLIEAHRLIRAWMGDQAQRQAETLASLRSVVSHNAYPPRAGQYTAEQVRAMLCELGIIEHRDSPIGDLVGLIESLGVPVELSAKLPTDVHGYTVYDEAMGQWESAVVVSVQDYWVRQRYTLAHELCHILYRDAGLASLNDSNTESSQVSNERRAECFAINLLAPPTEVKRLWKAHTIRGLERKAVCELILHFGVSRNAILNALENAALIDGPQRSELESCSVDSMMMESGLATAWRELVSEQNVPSASILLLESGLELYKERLVPDSLVASVLDRDPGDVKEELLAQGW